MSENSSLAELEALRQEVARLREANSAITERMPVLQVLHDVGEDTIYTCQKCKLAINKEIIDERLGRLLTAA